MITITLPDKSQRTFDAPPTGLDVAKSISEGFAATCVAMRADSRLKDISASIDEDSEVVFLTTRDEEALEIMRHSAAHVMAQAVLTLYPKAKLTIGPVIEGGFYYDFDMPPISEDDFARIEDEMRRIVSLKLPITRQEMSKDKALAIYADEPYKREIIEQLDDATVSVYTQEGFFDLCRGPHVPHTGFVKAFKLMKVSGAYWRGDSSKAQLQRIYGTAFFDKKELKKYLDFLEEAKKRDHRKWGQRLDLFSFHEEAPGMPFFHANGMALWNALLDYWRQEHRAAGYVETKTPLLLQKSLWVKSGHWENYRENMYTSAIDEVEYAIKPMNCPGGMLLYASGHHSYKDLPLRSAEIGFVHRHELSGVLSGLFRVRAFHQDDAHIFMTPEQMESEILGVLHLVERIYSTFGLGFHLELSTRPEKSIGTDAQWERATKGLTDALAAYGHDYKINEGDGAFYGPKIDIHIKDAIGRTWQCATVQLDMSLPERFDLYYIGPDNEKHRPIMIHRVIYGSVERFFGILVEHFAGRFPLWMAPVQASVLAMNDAVVPYAAQVRERLAQQGLRAELDDRAESINKKVRDAQLKAVPLMLTIGEKERESNTLALRTLDGKVRYNMAWDSFMDKVLAHIAKRGIEPDPFGGE
ncbi:MAG: threonine--tRNA ligase [Desulfatibacillaceae bacterium]|nr:threonine--tRNA ligase [Desulfatibacillaceae bacterium]